MLVPHRLGTAHVISGSAWLASYTPTTVMVTREGEGEYLRPIRGAMIHAQLHDFDAGIARLTQAADERASWIWLGFETVLDPLRSDPRYTDLLRRVRLA